MREVFKERYINNKVRAKRPHVLVWASDELFDLFFTPETIANLEEIADWTRYAGRLDSAEVRPLIDQSDALITTWHTPILTSEMTAGAKNLQLIAHCGGEIKKHMEIEVFNRLTVTNAPEAMAEPVAEMALALTLSLVRRLPQYEKEMRNRGKVDNRLATNGETLFGRRIGLIGFGRIGQAFARLLETFRPELLVYDPYFEKKDNQKIKFVELKELLKASSVVVLAAGLTPESENMLNAETLALLPDGAYLINIARGGLIDLTALLAELRTGRLSAALDVTDPLEILPENHELRQLPNVILTPHIAAGGIEVRQKMGAIVVEDVRRFFSGEKPLNIVTAEMLRKMS